MCGEMGKAVLRALTGALLCGMVSDAAYLQTTHKWPPYQDFDYEEATHSTTFPPRPFSTPQPDFELLMDQHTPAINWFLGRYDNPFTEYSHFRGRPHTSYSYGTKLRHRPRWKPLRGLDTYLTDPKGLLTYRPWRYGRHKTWVPKRPRFTYSYHHPSNYDDHYSHAKPLREHEKPQDLRHVPGIPGVDYPIYHEVPHTSFSCAHVPVHPGMYANVETGCQAWHICHDGREGHQGASFLCTNGTLFDQEKFACDWWYNVDCSQAIEHYKLNADPLKNPYVPKPKPEELEHQGIYYKL